MSTTDWSLEITEIAFVVLPILVGIVFLILTIRDVIERRKNQK